MCVADIGIVEGTLMKVSVEVNGELKNIDVEPDELVIRVIRDQLGLTGTKLGCGTGDCGACTIIMNGMPVSSCLVYAAELDRASIATVEGVVRSQGGRAVIDAFIEHDASQCGFCTPGIIVIICALMDQKKISDITEKDIVTSLSGNLCRCTGYLSIKRAIYDAFASLDVELT